MIERGARFRRGSATPLCVAGFVWALAPSYALAQTRAAVDITAGARAATNPYDSAGKQTAAIAASLSVDPSFFIQSELSTFTLTGSARVDRYLSRYGTDLSARANADYERRLSEAATVGATASFATTRSGISELLRSGQVISADGVQLVIPDQQLIDVAGTPSRQNRYNFSVRANVRPSEFDSLQASTGVALSRVVSGRGQDFRQLFTNFAYTRVLSESTSVTARVGFSDVNYRGRSNGDGQIFSPLLGLNSRLSSSLTFSIAGGVSIARIDQNGKKRSQTGLAAQASLCKRGELTNLCLSGSRDTQPSSFGGVTRATSLGLSFDQRLSPASTVALAAHYGRTDQPSASQNEFGFRRTQYVSATASYSRQLSERAYLTLAPGFDKVFDDGTAARRANYEVMAGIRVCLGHYR